MLLLQVVMMVTTMTRTTSYISPSTPKTLLLTDSTPSMPLSVLYISGGPVMMEGDRFQLFCQTPSFMNTYDFIWEFLSRSSGVASTIGSGPRLPEQIATVEDSGNYSCTVNNGSITIAWCRTQLTVIERLTAPSVQASPQGSMVLEGSGVVTLKCVTTSGPAHISWSWYRLAQGWAGPQKVGANQELILRRVEDSGQYQCWANTSTLGLSQESSSLEHQVNIIPSPAGLPIGQAALSLAILCLVLLLLLAVWIFIHRKTKLDALQRLADSSPAKGFPGPGVELKEDSRPPEDDVYINCETSGEPYTNLNQGTMTEEDTYDCLT